MHCFVRLCLYIPACCTMDYITLHLSLVLRPAYATSLRAENCGQKNFRVADNKVAKGKCVCVRKIRRCAR